LFFYDWRLSLALFWVVPLAAAIIIISKKIQLRGFLEGYLKKRKVSEQIQEGLETIQEIKSYAQEDSYMWELNNVVDDYEKQLIRGELLVGGLVNTAQSFLRLGLASVIIIGSSLVSSGGVDLFTYLIFLMVASRVYVPVSEVFNNLAALFYLDVRIDRMREMAALPVQQGISEFKPSNYNITFDSVSFSYEKGCPVLRDVSFEAKQGEKTALVGPSGGGKSTSAKLSARFWDVDSGRILLGGRDIRDIDPEILLKSYSIVFQDVVLFNASIMENIRMGKHGASDKEVLKAAGLAQCDDFVRKMSKGYKTIIGENGQTLSGGERQRISIARALLKDAPIVLLDEATASLDAENETKIQEGISELVRNKTVIIIAHRMRTVVDVDKIVVLESGSVAEVGPPELLGKKNGIFTKMVERQKEGVK
jgi:ATP-binding cassette, subfamily B, bacterial IrtB/YbtQ